MGQAFRQILGEAARQQGATLHAWLLLHNRVHLLVTPREASITTRYMAVMAKPMTMAVSTSDWGIGSA